MMRVRHCSNLAWLVVLVLCLFLCSCFDDEEKTPATTQQQQGVQQGEQPTTPKRGPKPAGAARPGPVATQAPGSSEEEAPSSGAPVIEDVSFEPSLPVTGDRVKVRVSAKDPEDQTITLSYKWTVNGNVVQESEADVLAVPVTVGDMIEVEVTASDGFDTGKTERRSVIVKNAAPTIQLGSQSVEGNTYRARLQVSDPEGEPVTLSLRNGPPGMTVDSSSSIIEWPVTEDSQGTHQIEVSATDSNGAETVLSFQVKIKMETQTPPGGTESEQTPTTPTTTTPQQ